jgi:serine/threonine-protein kinase
MALFEATIDLPAGQRTAFLDKECDGDPALRAGVERLLAVADKAETVDFDFLRPEFLEPLIDGDIPLRPPDFGPYEDIVYYGHGGMGVVYRAFDNTLRKCVALKLPLSDDPASLGCFRREPQKIAQLRHPNIIQVHAVGEHEGRPYFTMSLIEGPDSDLHLHYHTRDPRVAAALMVKVARAVQHAHDHKILHRDLKPGNILLDNDREPLVTDFGLATEDVWSAVAAPEAAAPTLADAATRSFQGIVGTMPFMSPEQAETPKKVTKKSDVYGLGAVLYALLTGRPPFRGETWLETRDQVLDRTRKPEPPRNLNPRVDRDLQAVCLMCLNKDPDGRYPSAERFARDLERWLDGRETEARPWGLSERVLRAFRRRPFAAALTGASAVLLAATAVTAIVVARERRARLEAETLRSNSYAAYGIASTVLWQLEEWSKPVDQIARDPKLRKLLGAAKGPDFRKVLKDPKADPMQRYVDDTSNPTLRLGKGSPFESWYVEDYAGTLLAVNPLNKEIVGDRFDGRDYFKGAMRHARDGRTGLDAVHISRVFLAKDSNIYKFAISAPVRDGDAPDAPVLGVVVATMTTNPTLGWVRLSDERRTAVLAGQGDIASPRWGAGQGAPPGYLILVHPRYKRGEKPVKIPSDRIGEIIRQRPGGEFQLHELDPKRASDSSYEDPIDHSRQLVGFAQVGNTELIVMVQQPYDQAVESQITWAVTLVASIGLVTFLVLLLTGIVAQSMARRRKDHAVRPGFTPTQ